MDCLLRSAASGLVDPLRGVPLPGCASVAWRRRCLCVTTSGVCSALGVTDRQRLAAFAHGRRESATPDVGIAYDFAPQPTAPPLATEGRRLTTPLATHWRHGMAQHIGIIRSAIRDRPTSRSTTATGPTVSVRSCGRCTAHCSTWCRSTSATTSSSTKTGAYRRSASSTRPTTCGPDGPIPHTRNRCTSTSRSPTWRCRNSSCSDTGRKSSRPSRTTACSKTRRATPSVSIRATPKRRTGRSRASSSTVSARGRSPRSTNILRHANARPRHAGSGRDRGRRPPCGARVSALAVPAPTVARPGATAPTSR